MTPAVDARFGFTPSIVECERRPVSGPGGGATSDSIFIVSCNITLLFGSGPVGSSFANSAGWSPSTITVRARPTGAVVGSTSSERASVVNRAGGSTPYADA